MKRRHTVARYLCLVASAVTGIVGITGWTGTHSPSSQAAVQETNLLSERGLSLAAEYTDRTLNAAPQQRPSPPRLMHSTPRTNGKAPADPWDVSKLPDDCGMLAAGGIRNGWHAINLGISTPLLTLGPSATVYMANSTGVWQQTQHRWLLLENSTKLGTVSSITVSNQGALYVIANSQVFTYKNHNWIQVSHFEQQSLRFLTWSPQGNLVAGVDVYSNMQGSSSPMSNGPAPTPSLGFMEYNGQTWTSADTLVPYGNKERIRRVAWSQNGHLAISFDYAGIGILTGHGWIALQGQGTPLNQNSVVNDIAWLGDALVVATNHGVWRYQNGDWSPLRGVPGQSNVLALSACGKDVIVTVQNPDMSYTSWVGKEGAWRKIPMQMMGVRYAGISAKGMPFLELLGATSHRELWQFLNGSWQAISMKGFPVETNMDSYNPWFPQDVTWSPTGELTVASRNHGVWQWNGSKWNRLGGDIDATHLYSTGDIKWMSHDTLVANVDEVIPPPPTTPRMLHNMLWTYQRGQWHHLEYPKSVTENVIEGLDVSAKADSIAMTAGSGLVHVWQWTNGSWREIGDGSGPLRNLRNGSYISFAQNGRVTVPLSDPMNPTQNGVYEYDGSHWLQILKSPGPLRVRNTYWFHYIWAPDGSMVFSVMNASGYHLWRYAKDKWSDLGLANQNVVRMNILTDGTLFAITDTYVCCVRKL